MSFKKTINRMLGFLIFGFLVTGFQIQDGKSETMNSILSIIGVEEAYAGPCSRRGCDGEIGTCNNTCYMVFEIGNVAARRCCNGTDTEEGIPEQN